MVFSDDSRSSLLLVLFVDGGFGVWDIEDGMSISFSVDRMRSLRAVDVCWAPSNRIFCALQSGALAIYDMNLICCSCPYDTYRFQQPLKTPALLKEEASFLKLSLEYLVNPDEEAFPKLQLFDVAEFYQKAQTLSSIACRSAYASELLADKRGIDFWTSFSLHKTRLLDAERETASLRRRQQQRQNYPTFDHVPAPDAVVIEELEEGDWRVGGINEDEDESVPTYREFDYQSDPCSTVAPEMRFNLDSQSVLSNQQIRASRRRNCLSSAPGASDKSIEAVAMDHIKIGDPSSGIRMFLSTSSDSAFFSSNGLKACLAAAVLSPQHFNYTVKLVARNMIAGGDLDGGVNLLCLVGRTEDACRYLTVYNRCEEASILAKTSLSQQQHENVVEYWANSLCDSGPSHWWKAIALYISIGQTWSVVDLLCRLHRFDLVCAFVGACLQERIVLSSCTLDLARKAVEAHVLSISKLLPDNAYVKELSQAILDATGVKLDAGESQERSRE